MCAIALAVYAHTEPAPTQLFLNKSDLLRKKLEDGVMVNKYVVSYADRPNTYDQVEKCTSRPDLPQTSRLILKTHVYTRLDFKAKFDAIRRQQCPPDRPVFTHITSCVDQRTTSSIIHHIQDLLMRANLKTSALM